MRLVLLLEGATPSLNELANKRTRWAYRRNRARWLKRLSDAWFTARAAAGRGPEPWLRPPKGTVRVTVERLTARENPLDYDNLIGGLKPLLDGMRKLQFIDDDNPRAIELVARQPKREGPGANMTRLTLERLE